MSRRETMERKEEAGHARQRRGYQEPFGPSVGPFTSEHAKEDDQADEESDQADQDMNYCVDVQYYRLPITSICARNVTSRFVVIAQYHAVAFCDRMVSFYLSHSQSSKFLTGGFAKGLQHIDGAAVHHVLQFG
jgi:maltooligosyltrehalose synthase